MIGEPIYSPLCLFQDCNHILRGTAAVSLLDQVVHVEPPPLECVVFSLEVLGVKRGGLENSNDILEVDGYQSFLDLVLVVLEALGRIPVLEEVAARL